MENIPEEWFSIQTVREWGGIYALGVFSGIYGLATAIRREWVSLAKSVTNAVDLGVALEKIRNLEGDVTRLTDENESLREQIDNASGGG